MEVLRVVTTEDKFTNIPGDIQIESKSGRDAYQKIKSSLGDIGKITRVVHYMNQKKGRYVTYVLGTRGAIRERGGLVSGGTSEGVKNFCKVLELCGFDKEKVWKEIIQEERKVSRLEFVVTGGE